MQKNRFLWLTIPMVSALTAAGIVLLILREHTLIVLLVCYVLGAVIGDLLCDRDDGSWILSWIRARRQGKKEADAEYGSDHETAARAANDAQTYLLIRVIGGFFGLFFRLVTLAFVAAAVSVSWIVRVIVSLVGWIKAKPSEAAAAISQPCKSVDEVFERSERKEPEVFAKLAAPTRSRRTENHSGSGQLSFRAWYL